MRVGICDINQNELETSEQIIRKYLSFIHASYDVMTYASIDALRLETNPLDVLFIDVDCGEESGIEEAALLQKQWHQCQIIFMANQAAYVSDVYKVEHTFFVLKDHLSNYIELIFQRVFRLHMAQAKKVHFRISYDHHIALAPSSILYVERNLRKSNIYTNDGVYEVEENIPTIFEKLAPYGIIRTHNSFLVALKMIRELYADYLILEGDIRIPVSRRFKKDVKEKFLFLSFVKQ